MATFQRAHYQSFGGKDGDIVTYETYRDKLGILTPNATTPYVVSFVNLMRTGPVVIDLPAGPNASGVCQLAADAEAGRLQHGTAHLWSGRCNHESDLAAPNGKESAVTAR
jgi:hypothetical protein